MGLVMTRGLTASPSLPQLGHPVEVCEQGPEADERLPGGKSCALGPGWRDERSGPWGRKARPAPRTPRPGPGAPSRPSFLFGVLLLCTDSVPHRYKENTPVSGWVFNLMPSRFAPTLLLLEGEAAASQIQIFNVIDAPGPLAEGGGIHRF